MSQNTDLNHEQPPPTSLSSHSSHVQKTVSEDRRQDVGDAHARPEVTEPDRELRVLVEVGEIEDYLRSLSACRSHTHSSHLIYIWDEAALEYAEKSSASEKRGSPREPELAQSYDAPDDELCWDPAVRSHPFRDELRWQLGQ